MRRVRTGFGSGTSQTNLPLPTAYFSSLEIPKSKLSYRPQPIDSVHKIFMDKHKRRHLWLARNLLKRSRSTNNVK
jgi:hypothetical protein